MKSAYTAIIEKEGGTYGVYFPDFDGCVSVGSTVPEVMRNAEEVLAFHIQGMREDGEAIPLPSEPPLPEDIRANEFLALISVDVGTRARRVNVMLNESLLGQIDAVASNRSGFLAEAAQEKLTRLRDGTD